MTTERHVVIGLHRSNSKMHFILLGFSQENHIRHFSFEGIAADGTRTGFSVDADLQMLPQFRIKVQELPLMCRQLLETQSEALTVRTLTLTERDMRQYADTIAAALLKHTRKPPFSGIQRKRTEGRESTWTGQNV